MPKYKDLKRAKARRVGQVTRACHGIIVTLATKPIGLATLDSLCLLLEVCLRLLKEETDAEASS